jgi:hypothetical protein
LRCSLLHLQYAHEGGPVERVAETLDFVGREVTVRLDVAVEQSRGDVDALGAGEPERVARREHGA